MKLEGTYTFDAPRDLVWEMFFEPKVLAKTMPGCEKLEMVGENTFEGKMRVQVGPVQGAFEGKVELTDLQEPESYHMKVTGRGPAGFVNGEGDIRLEENEDGTVMHYGGDAQVGGRLAQVGQRLMDSSARAIVKESLENLARQIDARQKGGGEPTDDNDEAAEGPPAPSQTAFAVGVAKEMAADFIPPEKRPQLITTILATLGFFLVFQLLLDWWSARLARKIARHLREREV